MDAPQAVTFPPGRAVIDLPGQLPAVVQTPYIDKRELRSCYIQLARHLTACCFTSEQAIPALSESEKDQLFKRRVQEGLSRNAASMEVYGRRYAGDLVERGKRALGEL